MTETKKTPTEMPMPIFSWYNYQTDEYDGLTEPPTDYSAYIPQHQAAQMLYRLYQEVGDTPIAAALKVLAKCTQEVTP